jgi:ankyrin repeat protein
MSFSSVDFFRDIKNNNHAKVKHALETFIIDQKVKNNALMIACEYSTSSIMKLLLESGADPNVPSKNDQNSLMIACNNRFALLDKIKVLLDFGANPNIKNKYGYTALMYSIEGVDVDIVKELIKAGADPNVKNKNGLTALDIAEEYETDEGSLKGSDLLKYLRKVTIKKNNSKNKKH